jgi:hypothetical protein
MGVVLAALNARHLGVFQAGCSMKAGQGRSKLVKLAAADPSLGASDALVHPFTEEPAF